MCKWAKSFSFRGTSSPRLPTGALPLDPTGTSVPRSSWLASIYSRPLWGNPLKIRNPEKFDETEEPEARPHAGFNPSMQPGGGNRPLEIIRNPPGILPGKFLKYGRFFIYIALSVIFEGYFANCALIWTIQLFKCNVIVTKCAFLTVYFQKKL